MKGEFLMVRKVQLKIVARAVLCGDLRDGGRGVQCSRKEARGGSVKSRAGG